MAIEREYKIDSSSIKDPLQVDIGVGLSKVDEVRREQLSLYFDSKNLDLGRLGIGLRFRTAHGEPTLGVWTMKIPRNFNSAGATQREEIEVEGDRDEIPGPIRKALQRLNLKDSTSPGSATSELSIIEESSNPLLIQNSKDDKSGRLVSSGSMRLEA